MCFACSFWPRVWLGFGFVFIYEWLIFVTKLLLCGLSKILASIPIMPNFYNPNSTYLCQYPRWSQKKKKCNTIREKCLLTRFVYKVLFTRSRAQGFANKILLIWVFPKLQIPRLRGPLGLRLTTNTEPVIIVGTLGQASSCLCLQKS